MYECPYLNSSNQSLQKSDKCIRIAHLKHLLAQTAIFFETLQGTTQLRFAWQ